MRPLKLHIKTSLIASLITILMLGVALAFVSVRIAGIFQQKEKDLARTQTSELAEHIENLAIRDDVLILQSANLVSGTQPGLTAVRVWKNETGGFRELIASADSQPAQDIAPAEQTKLRAGKPTETLFESGGRQIFRAFAPIKNRNGNIFGAVEIAQNLDSPQTVAADYLQSEIGVAVAATALLTAAIYLLFRWLVYRPLKMLLGAMTQAEAGDLAVQTKVFADDEFGQVAAKFNLMVASLGEATREREAYQETLRLRVAEATAELKNKNEQLSDVNRELWQMSRKLSETERLAAAGQTAAEFAHEVGTPLNLISGHVQLLRLRETADDSRLSIISDQIERIERIVRGMLDRTRIARGEREPLDINDILRRTFDVTAPALSERKVALKETLAENQPKISGDADQLQQVFINLINNALDAMPAGGTLTVKTGSVGEEVYVDLADTGSGMTEDVKARIFDVLYTTKGRRGTGLGLVVVKQIVQEHGGIIEVKSAENEGTRFRLSFPVAH